MYEEILAFWFEEISPKQQFAKDDSLDQMIRTRFMPIHQKATRVELYSWRQTISGRLAEIIILDQFSRNMFRDDPRAFRFDEMSLTLAQEAVASGRAKELPAAKRAFLYMPFMHSESLVIHEIAEKLFSEPGLEENLIFEKKHQKIIARFGRYPHRNKILGRESTAEERAFLKQPDSSF